MNRMNCNLRISFLAIGLLLSISSTSHGKNDENSVLPIAPQISDGYDGVKQNSFAPPSSASFSSELLSNRKKEEAKRSVIPKKEVKKALNGSKKIKKKTKTKKKRTLKK